MASGLKIVKDGKTVGVNANLGDDIVAQAWVDTSVGKLDEKGELYLEGEITPKDIWDSREKLLEVTNWSKEEVWENMNQEERDAAIVLIKRAIARFYDRVDEWLPEGFEHVAGGHITARFMMLSTDLDAEVERTHELTQFELARLSDDFGDLLELVRSSVDPDVLKAVDLLAEKGLIEEGDSQRILAQAAPGSLS